MSSLSDIPTRDELGLEDDLWLSNDEARYDKFHQLSTEIVKAFTDLEVTFGSSRKITKDHVLAYSQEVLSLGLLYMEYCDVIREGDGLRILRCWRYFMPFFKASKRKNYAIEALTFLSQYHFFYLKDKEINFYGPDV